jgi:hypothetical protein
VGIGGRSPFPYQLGKQCKGSNVKHQLRFELDREDGGWSVYLLGRDDAIGHIRPTPNGRWTGDMLLDGQRDTPTDDDPQAIVDRFRSFAAVGVPSQSELQAENLAKARTWVANLAAPNAGEMVNATRIEKARTAR